MAEIGLQLPCDRELAIAYATAQSTPIAFWARRLSLMLNEAASTKFGPDMAGPLKPIQPTLDVVFSAPKQA
jgi:hypothetical protein